MIFYPGSILFSCSVGGKLPFEAIFVSCKDSSHSPTVVILHGGPHSVSVSSYSKSSAFLASLGFNLLIINYRYSLGIPMHFTSYVWRYFQSDNYLIKRGTPGYGEEALQSLPGKVGSQVQTLVEFSIFVPPEPIYSQLC